MMRGSIIRMTSALFLFACVLPQTAAGGALPSEDRWASSHIDLLPGEIRQTLGRLKNACGWPQAAEHYFALYLSGARHQFVALHFEHFRCHDRAAVCTQTRCLHQVFESAGGKYRLVWSGRVSDLEMKLVGDHPAIDITCDRSESNCPHMLVWNGDRFVAR